MANGVLKFVAHGRKVVSLGVQHGWRPGARYTNLRDVRHVTFSGAGFLDIHWRQYSFSQHLEAAKRTRPFLTVARDILSKRDLADILREAEELKRHARHVIVVPKDGCLSGKLNKLIPSEYILGYSVPTRYGGTCLQPQEFDRPVHLLGGRPDVQRELAHHMPVVSLDCNRFTFDARFGDYFDGERFRPHPTGGYDACLKASLSNITALWAGYSGALGLTETG